MSPVEKHLTFKKAIESFLTRDLSANTRRAFLSDLKRFAVHYANWPVNRLTRAHLETYLGALVARTGEPVSVATYNRHFGTLQNLFNWLVSLGKVVEGDVGVLMEGIETSPMEGLKRRRAPKRLPRPLSKQNVDLILGRIDSARDKALFTLLYDSGLRIQEALTIGIEDLDLRNGTVRIWGKGERERVGFLSQRTVHRIQRYLQERGKPSSGPVFVSRQYTETAGARLSYAMAYRLFRKYAEGLTYRGQPATIHQLRHSFGSERAGVIDALALRQLMGHKSLRTTMQYAEVNPSAAREAFLRYEAIRNRE